MRGMRRQPFQFSIANLMAAMFWAASATCVYTLAPHVWLVIVIFLATAVGSMFGRALTTLAVASAMSVPVSLMISPVL
jgi:hypothetical protein